ncbi:hypothetical protein SPD48_17525 [Pseudogracilibacillus sp. SE30717A]|uniref:hypothetical protein n=1 Tax=Pseudogracilibacillus sp. SE30717A TaxID=3098293 RepID=UPI00300DF30E
MQHVTKYYVSGHTAEGYVNFLSSNLVQINKVIVLQHPSNRLKTRVLEKLAAPFEGKEHIERICSSRSNDYLEGIIMRESSLAVLAEQVVKDKINNATYINLENYQPSGINKDLLKEFESKIVSLQNEAYTHFKRGLIIHDDLEKIYINEMDFNKADQEAEQFIHLLFNGIKKKQKDSIIYERLFGTNTSDGVVNLVEHLIDPIENRVFIKGRAGTGKSFFMKKILESSIEHGFDIELYHCSFDPESIDMLIIRELDYCLFDSTDPHEFFPSREGDQIIDLYEKTVAKGTDEKYATEISKLTIQYKTEMREGINKLRQTKLLEREKEKRFKEVNEVELESAIQKIAIKQ